MEFDETTNYRKELNGKEQNIQYHYGWMLNDFSDDPTNTDPTVALTGFETFHKIKRMINTFLLQTAGGRFRTE